MGAIKEHKNQMDGAPNGQTGDNLITYLVIALDYNPRYKMNIDETMAINK